MNAKVLLRRWTSWRNLRFARRHSKSIREMELRRYANTGNPIHDPDWTL